MAGQSSRRGIAPARGAAPRRDRRRWSRGIARRASVESLLTAIPSFPRPMLERTVAAMIEHIDAIDGDTDLEPDDDAEAENEDGREEEYEVRPVYGIDQSLGAINRVEAMRAYDAKMRIR